MGNKVTLIGNFLGVQPAWQSNGTDGCCCFLADLMIRLLFPLLGCLKHCYGCTCIIVLVPSSFTSRGNIFVDGK